MKRYHRILSNGLRTSAIIVVAVAAAAGCSRSVGQFQQVAAPVVIAPTGPQLAGTSSDLGAVQPTALVSDQGASPMTPEEKARVIAELEALARQQADF